MKEYDIIVVGGGHAGCEAAAAAANLGSKVLLITMNMNTLGLMSCNPAMGGVAKGQIVREIDALGGLSGIIADKSMIQFRMLNRSKGPAMWSPRSQNDRNRFTEEWRLSLEKIKNIFFWQDMVCELIVKNSKVKGVITKMGIHFYSKAVILTNGTFLNGIIHIGENKIQGGRSSEPTATGITENLIALGFESGRMKTGTPPRVDGRSLNVLRMEIQEGDKNPSKFSFSNTQHLDNQLPCYITYTNSMVHETLKKGFNSSPLYTGRIQGIGPRYCPSIEDKITRFSERERHQLFVEPEGWNTVEVYVNGFSTSLPFDIQFEALRLVPGFENVRFFRPGYAIEYDFFPPHQLYHSLETKLVENLFFAGQINGTTGYEEAAGQGIIAGINAHQKINDKDSLVLKRNEAYIGVLIDDLVMKGTNEPYRMFTSRAEHRIILRQDNADLRLTPIAHTIGLASQERYDKVVEKQKQISDIEDILRDIEIQPGILDAAFTALQTSPLSEKSNCLNLLKRPQLSIHQLITMDSRVKNKLSSFSDEAIEQVEIGTKYAVYIDREHAMIERITQLENFKIRSDFDYDRVAALSAEGKEKLKKIRPETIGQLSRISGVSPSDVAIITVYLRR